MRTAYLLAGDHHDAEDLVQSALVKVVPKWARIQDRPEGYVRAVLARESVNRWRVRRWREVPTEVVPEAMHYDSTERIALLDDLRRLSPRQRRCSCCATSTTSPRPTRLPPWASPWGQ